MADPAPVVFTVVSPLLALIVVCKMRSLAGLSCYTAGTDVAVTLLGFDASLLAMGGSAPDVPLPIVEPLISVQLAAGFLIFFGFVALAFGVDNERRIAAGLGQESAIAGEGAVKQEGVLLSQTVRAAFWGWLWQAPAFAGNVIVILGLIS